jgi:hypothetical protein
MAVTDLVVISHPDIAGTAIVRLSAFTAVWEPLGWVNDGSVTGPGVAPSQLIEWTEAEAYETLTVTYRSDVTTLVDEATVRWPDGSGGVYTSTAVDEDFELIDAYTITHAGSGKTVTQAAVTRNGSGQITTKPPLVVT